MKKLIYNKYGNTDVLQLIDTPFPVLLEIGILVKVKAVSINPLDWKIFKGEERLMSGSAFPKGLGIDFSGIVEDVGSSISSFKKGDEVFGLFDAFKGKALAEYIVVREKDIAIKPSTVSFEQAAAAPVVGLSALQILDNLSLTKSGTQMLINGATGGIGMFLTQLAKKRGATITATVGSRGMEMARKWGADGVIDYRKQNILTAQQKFDVVVDLSGKLSFKHSKPLLNRHATFITTIPGLKSIAGSFFNNLLSPTKYRVLILKPTNDGLNHLANLISQDIDIVVEKVYPITAAKLAYNEVARGGLIGKAVITL